MVNQVIN